MKITIITATWNSNQHIRKCLQSVSEQTYKNIEHIVIDGDSTDNTMQIIKTFPSVSKSISEPDKGIYDALNKGIKLATGDVIGLLHSDDKLALAEVLEQIATAFKNTNADGVYGNLVFVKTGDKVVRKWVSNKFKRWHIYLGWMPPHPTLFLRKEVYQKHGLFDTSFKIAGDYDFMLRVMLDKEINLCYLPEVITRMRMGGASTGSFKDIITKSKEDIRALRNNGFRFPIAVLASKNLRKLPQLLHR